MSFLQASMGGGSSFLENLTDVDITSPQDGDMLMYDDFSDKWINVSSGVTVTLTIKGAKEDTITIYDSNNTLLGTCIFGSGNTSGEFTITVDSSYSDSWKFVSSVAKDPSNLSNSYTKVQTITDDTTQIVNIMPDKALYWYGNKCSDKTGGWEITYSYGFDTSLRWSHNEVDDINNIYLTFYIYEPSKWGMSFMRTINTIHRENNETIKIVVARGTVGFGGNGWGGDFMYGSENWIALTNPPSPNVKTLYTTVSSSSTENDKKITIALADDSSHAKGGDIYVYAVYKE